MEKAETIEEFYKRKFDGIEPGKAKPLPYKRRDFYKVMLVIGDFTTGQKRKDKRLLVARRKSFVQRLSSFVQ